MRPVRRASLLAETPHGVMLDCGDGVTCRVSLLAEGLARVLFLRGGAPRQKRTWMVPAPGAADVPWEGRDRMEEGAWPPPSVTRADGGLTLATAALTLRIQLDPFRLTWMRPDGQVFLADRPGMAWMLSRRGTAVAHYLAIGVKIALDLTRVGPILGRCKTQHLSRRINLKSCCGDFPPVSIWTASPDKPRRLLSGSGVVIWVVRLASI